MEQVATAPLAAAIVGAGTIGTTHARAYRETGARVVAVCDVARSERASRSCARPTGLLVPMRSATGSWGVSAGSASIAC
jgi:predicted dehydrogenase